MIIFLEPIIPVLGPTRTVQQLIEFEWYFVFVFCFFNYHSMFIFTINFVIRHTHYDYNFLLFFFLLLRIFSANHTTVFSKRYWNWKNTFICFEADSFNLLVAETLMHFIIYTNVTLIKTKIASFWFWTCCFSLVLLFFHLLHCSSQNPFRFIYVLIDRARAKTQRHHQFQLLLWSIYEMEWFVDVLCFDQFYTNQICNCVLAYIFFFFKLKTKLTWKT